MDTTEEGPDQGKLEGKAPQRRIRKREDSRLEEVAKAVAGGYCRLQMLKLALAIRVAGHRRGALEGRGVCPSLPMHPWAQEHEVCFLRHSTAVRPAPDYPPCPGLCLIKGGGGLEVPGAVTMAGAGDSQSGWGQLLAVAGAGAGGWGASKGMRQGAV